LRAERSSRRRGGCHRDRQVQGIFPISRQEAFKSHRTDRFRQLAVELATRFNGEIINGDAMQMYKGLPIITNKIPSHERHGIPHHLLNLVGPEERPWTVNQFVKESSRVIREIRSRGKLPIVVGGTHYYTHALLFKDATLAAEQDADLVSEDEESVSSEEKWPILSAPTEEIFAKLQEVDPEMARRWHPRDRRKVQRSLEIWLRTGRTASEIYAEQQKKTPTAAKESMEPVAMSPAAAVTAAEDPDHHNERLRYSTVLFWLEAEDAVLKERLNARVDSMVRDGLLEEALTLAALEQELKEQHVAIDKSKGIWVSIGYKELEPWLQLQADGGLDRSRGHQLADASIEAVKAGTRRYAKRQNRYIRIRLANALKRVNAMDRLFLLNCSDLEEWETAVGSPSREIVQEFLNGNPLPSPQELSPFAKQTLQAIITAQADGNPERAARHCSVCDKTLMTEKEWLGHLASRGHKKALQWHRKQNVGNDADSPNTTPNTRISEG